MGMCPTYSMFSDSASDHSQPSQSMVQPSSPPLSPLITGSVTTYNHRRPSAPATLLPTCHPGLVTMVKTLPSCCPRVCFVVVLPPSNINGHIRMGTDLRQCSLMAIL